MTVIALRKSVLKMDLSISSKVYKIHAAVFWDRAMFLIRKVAG